MNILTLIHQHPLLAADLKNLGISHAELQAIANAITIQIGGQGSQNLCRILAGMGSREFVHLTNASDVAQTAAIEPALAQSAILLIAPWINRFQLRAI